MDILQLEYKPEIQSSNEKPRNGKKALLAYHDYIDKKVLAGEISIFSLPKFPLSYPIGFSPRQLYDCIIDYSISTTGLEPLLKKYTINRNMFYRILEKYDECRELYEKSFYRKADSYEDLAADQLLDGIPEDCWKETKYGRELSYAGVRLLEHRFNGALRLAAIHNREIYGDKTQIDQRSVNLNLNASIGSQGQGDKDITNTDLIRTLFQEFRK